METPDFSIIVPTYNRPGQLARCLDSLAALDYPADRREVIVVDDGGDEPVGPLVECRADSLRARCLYHENAGPGAARNTGAESAAGRFLAFTDDDCNPAPDWLTQLREALDTDPSAMVGGRTVNALPDNPCSTASQVIVDLVYDYYNPLGEQAGFFATNNMAVPAESFRTLGGFASGFRTSEDRDLCDRWAASGRRLRYVPGAVVRHAHRLDVGAFWKQHVGYGRGARRFYLAHRAHDVSTSTIKSDFYWSLVWRVPQALKGKRRLLRVLCLLFVWQVANITGFTLETLFPRRGRDV